MLINQIIAKMNIREVLVDIEFDPGLALKSAEHRRTQHLLVMMFMLQVFVLVKRNMSLIIPLI